MGRQGWMLLRAYLPAASFGLALLLMIPLGWSQASPFVAGVFDVLRWVPVAIAGGAILLFGIASYRLYRWDSGNGPSCMTCGGPLGYPRLRQVVANECGRDQRRWPHDLPERRPGAAACAGGRSGRSAVT